MDKGDLALPCFSSICWVFLNLNGLSEDHKQILQAESQQDLLAPVVSVRNPAPAHSVPGTPVMAAAFLFSLPPAQVVQLTQGG